MELSCTGGLGLGQETSEGRLRNDLRLRRLLSLSHYGHLNYHRCRRLGSFGTPGGLCSCRRVDSVWPSRVSRTPPYPVRVVVPLPLFFDLSTSSSSRHLSGPFVVPFHPTGESTGPDSWGVLTGDSTFDKLLSLTQNN